MKAILYTKYLKQKTIINWKNGVRILLFQIIHCQVQIIHNLQNQI